MLGPQFRYAYVLLSGSVIVLAYVAAAAVIIPAVSMIGFGKIPKFLRRGAGTSKTRTRMEGTGLFLIGAFILADALAADLGRRSEVPQDWILLVWVLLAAGLIGIRYIAGRADATSRADRKPEEPAA
jgi:multisubunit Na+/H+ antiporter MnhG subunit